MKIATVAIAVTANAAHAVTLLYSMSMAMSSFFQNNLLLRKACNASVPFGDCTEGEAHAQHVVSLIYSWKAFIQYIIPVVLVVLAGETRDEPNRGEGRLAVLNFQSANLGITNGYE